MHTILHFMAMGAGLFLGYILIKLMIGLGIAAVATVFTLFFR